MIHTCMSSLLYKGHNFHIYYIRSFDFVNLIIRSNFCTPLQTILLLYIFLMGCLNDLKNGMFFIFLGEILLLRG